MKVILDFLKLQQAVSDGLTEEQIKEKLDYLKTLDKRDDISEEEFFRERKKIIDEVNPHRKNRREYNERLNYFAGKITSTDFTPKAYWKWKSEEKRKVYIDERDRWASEKAQILNDYTVPEILSMFVEKEKQKQLSLRNKLCAEIISVNETLHQISAVSNMIMFSEDVESYDMSPDDIQENKEKKPVLLPGKNFKASVLAKIKKGGSK